MDPRQKRASPNPPSLSRRVKRSNYEIPRSGLVQLVLCAAEIYRQHGRIHDVPDVSRLVFLRINVNIGPVGNGAILAGVSPS
jgi:hypothetical protein